MKSNSSEAYLQLIKVNRQLQCAKNSLKVYQQKQQTIKRRFMIKRKRLQKYQSYRQKQRQNIYQADLSLFPDFSSRAGQFLKSKVSRLKWQQGNNTGHKICHSNFEFTSRQKYENSIRQKAIDRRMEKKRNQQRKQFQQIENLELKKEKNKQIWQFQKNVALKRNQFMQNYVSRIKQNQSVAQSQILTEKISRKREIKRLLEQKEEISKSISNYKLKESQLYNRYCKSLKVRTPNLLDCMVKSIVVNDC